MVDQANKLLEQEISILKLMEVMTIKDTLAFMELQQHDQKQIMPRCICKKDMYDYEFDEAALLRLQAKLLQAEEGVNE